MSEVAGGEGLAAEIGRLRPAEILVSEGSTLFRELSAVRGLSRRPPWHFDTERAGCTLAGHFGVADTALSGARDHSLIGLMDTAVTAMGGRLLRRWVYRPIRDR